MWMNRMCRLGEAEELLSEMDFSDVADDIAEKGRYTADCQWLVGISATA